MEALAQAISLLSLLLLAAILASLAARAVTLTTRQEVANNLGSFFKLVLGLGLIALLVYVTLYFLALVGGFYEALTCKVVTLPACEDPLPLPTWLRLPEQSVGGVIGILPLLAVFMAKAVQSAMPPPLPESAFDTHWAVRGLRRLGRAVAHNFGVIVILAIEVWLAYLRGSAEAADRQVRLALGLDSELPLAYLSVAQWGAVVLALGLSAVVIYLGIMARYGRLLAQRAFAELDYGAGIVTMTLGLIKVFANALVQVWTMIAIALGRFALKLQSVLYRLWAAGLIAVGRFLLKAQSFVYRSWAFLATTLGWTVIYLGRLRRPGRRAVESLAFVTLLAGAGLVQGSVTYVVLVDASGGEAERLPATRQMVLGWADPSPQRALLARGDRLIVIPIVAPGNLDTVYSARFNASYPSSQLERYDFFVQLRDALPSEVDPNWGTGLSEALRAAAFYLREAAGERVLIVFGNGEDHSPEPITAAELEPALQGALVVHLNAGLEEIERWRALFAEAGASAQLVYDLAATRSLRQEELAAALDKLKNP